LWSRAIKYHISPLATIACGVASITMCFVTVLLAYEYHFFCKETEKMLELKDEYRNYIQAVKRVLTDYNSAKDEPAQSNGEENHDENKEALSAPISHIPPSSSEEETDTTVKNSFMMVNRDLAYLKQSMIDYLKDQHLSSLLDQINLYEWDDYNPDLVQVGYKRKGATRTKRRRIRRQRKASPQSTRAAAPANQWFARRKQRHVEVDMHLQWPIEQSQFWVSSLFGPRHHKGKWKFHYGIDLAAMRGTRVHAAAPGVVISAGYERGYGNNVVVMHDHKYKTRYAHLDSIMVKVGTKVEVGSLLGKVGATGSVRKTGSDASHLHFEIYSFGKQVNPIPYLK
jgi:murein DD-endopeptidase MepM/ murein hydrolase activator NlpD